MQFRSHLRLSPAAAQSDSNMKTEGNVVKTLMCFLLGIFTISGPNLPLIQQLNYYS